MQNYIELALQFIAAVGALGALSALLRARSENEKTKAEASHITQQAHDVEVKRLQQLVDWYSDQLEECLKAQRQNASN